MDLKQRKLSKSEWDSIEIPVSNAENNVLRLIIQGYSDVNIKINRTNSLFTYLKVEYNPQNEDYLYNKYFADRILQLVRTYNISFIRLKTEKNNEKVIHADGTVIYNVDVGSIVKLKSADQIRLNRINTAIEDTTEIYEFILIKYLEKLYEEKKKNNKHWQFNYYTLSKLIKNNVEKVNRHISGIINTCLTNLETDIELTHIIQNAVEYIEKNTDLLKYSDLQLYDHQKTIFTASKVDRPKLVLYIAPTGTGKTLTPLGLSESHKVIFVCAARHVGLAFARAAISIHKKIAFAFGCSSADDVRLHYFAASEYSVNKRTGKIRKVDNSVGNKVEIMICDIRSYIYAMYYMLAFNSAHQIITYWDEPTITLDYTNHELHKIIKKNWKENIIPNMVLSSATLPKIHELTETIADFKERFMNCAIVNIVSHDCKKSIPLIDNNGYVIMPHYLSSNYDDIIKIAEHCEENLTLLRYLDLEEASKFILFVDANNHIKNQAKLSRSFGNIYDIDMTNIKMHYLKTLKYIVPTSWLMVYNTLMMSRRQRIKPNDAVDTKGNKITKINSIGPGVSLGDAKGHPLSRTISQQEIPNSTTNNGICGMYVTTTDAHTLTDGPTIFLANDVQKIAKFCIQQANIPAAVMNEIVAKIEFNNQINEKISKIEKELEDIEERQANKTLVNSSSSSKDKKNDKQQENIPDGRVSKFREQIELLTGLIKNASLNDLFIPNRVEHQKKWTDMSHKKNVFTCDIDEQTIISIMLLKDVEDSWKVLLLLGIGVFTEHKSNAYTEIMKKLADQQKLYLIIADSDYIYGTNYQFCHGYLSKDLKLTQEKIIQAMGRIGRNNIQQEYSIRFRDNDHVSILFTKIPSEDKLEVLNMNILFNSKNVVWDGSQYKEIDTEMNEELENEENEEDDDMDEDDEEEIHNNMKEIDEIDEEE
jgi:hypothetical protein